MPLLRRISCSGQRPKAELEERIPVGRVDHVGLNVRDLAAQATWYRQAFGPTPVFEFRLEGSGLRWSGDAACA
ncbi:VOC family protein [Streptomyces sp. cf386]|uniref:VOC family protein n=1 Tax=Streptomyces sp. cf386 TaxID=1761904 RepID=UPI0015A37AA6|nr:VOC family protein [Streptomyces sp. cf386]